jgi:hypothetical protein
MSPGAQNVKTGPEALGIAEDVFERAKREKGPDALGTVENVSGRAKLENETRHHRNRRK